MFLLEKPVKIHSLPVFSAANLKWVEEEEEEEKKTRFQKILKI